MKISNCPFCKGEAIYNFSNPEGWCWIECEGCSAKTAIFYNKEEAIEAWNRRASGWFLLSERLPEKEGWYNVTGRDTEGNYVVCSAFYRINSKKGFWNTDGIIAWMPLPEPYKPEKE